MDSMKIRNGFVSNSSSSSFVVAFPHKPNSVEEVYKMMFNTREGGVDHPYSSFDDLIEGMSHARISEKVWDDIKSKKVDKYEDKRIPAKLKDIKEEFSNLYYYNTNAYYGQRKDEKGGSWSYPIGKYFGSDKKALDELRDLIICIEAKEHDIREKQCVIFKNNFKIERVDYASKCSKTPEGNPFTKKQIDDYEEYNLAIDKFKKENKEYVALQLELDKIWSEDHKKRNELEDKIAKIDAKAFCEDHKGSFIVILSYSDHSREGTILEQGNIFYNIPHVVISHH